MFTKLVDAYEILGDEDRRIMHDDDTFGAYQSRPHNFNAKSGFYTSHSLIYSLNETEFDRLVLCKGPFEGDESCVPWMVEFYTTWCVHCKNMIPDWKHAAATMDGMETPLGFVRFGAINCEAERRLCDRLQVNGYPTIHLYAHDAMGQDHMEPFPRGGRTAENIIRHAEKSIRLAHESTLRAIDAFVMEKNVTNSDSTGLWIVMFEDGHCAQCGPLKASLRRMSANMGGLANFGVLHCGNFPKVCQQQYIGNQYPILKMYPYQGSKGTGETLFQAGGADPLVVLPIVEKVIRMCIANIEAATGLMNTLHEEDVQEDDPPPPKPQYQYPQPEQQVHRGLPAGVKAGSGARYIAGG
jgi:thiol-disulfide isomerase/thioredoxin